MIDLKKQDNVADAVKQILDIDEGFMDTVKKVGKKIVDTVGHKDDDELIKDLQKKVGVPQTGKKPVKEELKGGQKNIDKNHNGKIDGQDFKLLRGQKKANEEVKDEYARKVDKYLKKKYNKEEVEQIDELKKSTMGSYVKKASSNLADRSFDHGESEHRQYGMGDDDEKDKEVERDEKKIETRKQGINRAASKLSKESVQIDELSKSTLGSYAKKATDDATYHSFSAGTRSSKDPERLKDDEKAMKRQSGVNKAVDRLAKEETGDKKMKTLNQFREGWNEMLADVKKRSQPQPNGGSGIKQGSRYGGGKQTSTPDQEAEKNEKKK